MNIKRICGVIGMKTFSLDNLLKIAALVIADALCASFAVYLAVYARFVIEYAALPTGTLEQIMELLLCWLPANLLVFALFKMYSRLWRYASVREAVQVVAAAFCSFLALVVLNELLQLFEYRGCYPLIWIFSTALVLGTRFFFRVLRVVRRPGGTPQVHTNAKNVMLIGAGSAGNTLLREFERDQKLARHHIVCAIDDDPGKIGKYIGEAKIVGGRSQIAWAVREYKIDEIIFAIPSADAETRRGIFEICKDTSCVIRALPSYYQLMNGEARAAMLQEVRISDLLQRPPITLELDKISQFIRGKSVLVTGAGGSIGSELCRQLAKYRPERLILFDIYENGVFFVQNELREQVPDLELVTLIGSVRDVRRLDSVFSTYRPDVVYHAAAHKHVPLMEDSPHEAVKNNVFGTLNTVKAADKYGVSRFVMISSDKAVNPTNVMGATKRICEMIVQGYNTRSRTEYVAVRFGNVLGSNGSVIPIFEKQIAKGGPVTVTHPDVIRYFMTIPEAVSLVLQAGSNARGGEIFVLDMGRPVKILTLAENMIRLSGHVPYEDIGIAFTGLRPGEKLFEELLLAEEGMSQTSHKQVFVAKPIAMDTDEFFHRLECLRHFMEDETGDVRIFIKEFVPTFHEGPCGGAEECPPAAVGAIIA